MDGEGNNLYTQLGTSAFPAPLSGVQLLLSLFLGLRSLCSLTLGYIPKPLSGVFLKVYCNLKTEVICQPQHPSQGKYFF
jgi:hypothetical protein